jgi:predicted nucleic-acid-binding protein
LKITADTNLLVRAMTDDDARQSPMAIAALAEAELVAVALSALCEVVWVLSKGYKSSRAEISTSIKKLLNAPNVALDRQAVLAGLDLLDAGGGFADGVIAHEGRALGGEVFVSFDKKAVKLMLSQDRKARVLA